jgi:SNF2 family DNA or RNA helicase
MIRPAAIDDFLRRKLDNHEWVKKLDEPKLDEAIGSLVPKPDLSGDKFHQKIGFLLGLSFPQIYYIYEMGTGKTRLALRLLEYHYKTKNLQGWSVVLVKTDEAVGVWEDEIKKIGCRLPYVLLQGSSEEKWARLERFDQGLVIVTYIGYAAMVSELREVVRKGRKKRERVPNPGLMRHFHERVDGLVADEITACGNTQSLTYEVVRGLSFAAKVRYGLAGRPFGRDPTMIWPQMYLIDHGASLGTSLGVFREAFFVKKKNYWGGPYSFDYKLDKKKEPELARAIAHRSLRYSIDECVDLPELVPMISQVPFSAEQRAYYERVTTALIKARGNFREVENAFIRMRQISSGFLGFVDDDTGEKAQIEFKQNPKLDDLMDKLDDLPEGRKAIVWHEYTWTGARICRELAKSGKKHGWLWGGTKNWNSLKNRFDNDPDFQVLVVSHKKGAFSLNLQAANYDLIFESPVSPIDREQMERRTWRQGQLRRVFRYDLVVRNSVDVRILAFHREGADIFKALVANPQKTLGL